MRPRSVLLAAAVLLIAAPLCQAQVFFSGPLSIYGARFAYTAPYIGSPVYGPSAYGAFGYTYATPAAVYPYGVLPRHARLARSMWIFAAPTTTTVTPSGPSTITGNTSIPGLYQVSGSTINDLQGKITEAENWKNALLGTATKPVAPPDKEFAQQVKDFVASLTDGDRTALAGANTRTAARLRSGAGKKVQDVVPLIFFSEAISGSPSARKTESDLIYRFYDKQSWKAGDILDEADRRSTLAKLFDDLSSALKP